VNINLRGQLTGITTKNLNDFGGSAVAIYEACDVVAEALIAELHEKVQAHEAYLDRLIRFCHTGK
jgi:hypothetical protein